MDITAATGTSPLLLVSGVVAVIGAAVIVLGLVRKGLRKARGIVIAAGTALMAQFALGLALDTASGYDVDALAKSYGVTVTAPEGDLTKKSTWVVDGRERTCRLVIDTAARGLDASDVTPQASRLICGGREIKGR